MSAYQTVTVTMKPYSPRLVVTGGGRRATNCAGAACGGALNGGGIIGLNTSTATNNNNIGQSMNWWVQIIQDPHLRTGTLGHHH